MSHRPEIEEFPNRPASRPQAPPLLSVLIPFYNTSPRDLVAALAEAASGHEHNVEIVAADDGSPDRSLAPALVEAMAGMTVPCRLLSPARNLGRSRIRNRLCEAARGKYVLFLDGDMQLPDDRFLIRYLDLINSRQVDVVFGGFDMPGGDQAPPAYDLHIYDSRRSHCLPAIGRSKSPEKYTYTSNLLVRRELMAACPFSEEFSGWGWEDVDWSLSMAGRARIDHIDNPAVHAGFSTAEALLAKYRESIVNFRRLYARHPQKVRELPIFRASRVMSRVPFPSLLQASLEAVMLGRERWPLRVRYLAMKLLRACLYREVVRSSPAG